jgi:hypothetical protein
MAGDYEIGYSKPPKSTQFQKGQSGNPAGRAKGTKNLGTDLLEELQELVLVREAGGEKQLSKQRALLKSITAKAIKGDTRAANLIVSLVLRILEEAPDDGTVTPLSSEEWAILQSLEARLPRKPESNGGAELKSMTGAANDGRES